MFANPTKALGLWNPSIAFDWKFAYTDRNPYFLKEEDIMVKKLYDSLDETLKEKVKNCKDDAEMQKIFADAGLELSDEILEGVSGGRNPPIICLRKLDGRGQLCQSYRFM